MLKHLIKKTQRPLIIYGASGAGKTTVIQHLLKQYSAFKLTVSHTTRKQRTNEQNGIDYHFVTKQQFQQLQDQNQFLETCSFAEYSYGTSIKEMNDILSNNKVPLLDVDYNGVKSMIKIFDSENLIKLLIKQENMNILKDRLVKRGMNTDQEINNRIQRAIQDTQLYEKEKLYDYLIVNKEIKLQIKNIIFNQFEFKITMKGFQTERKIRKFDDDYCTPIKPLKKLKIETIMKQDKENQGQNSPLTQKLKINIQNAFNLQELIIEQLDVFQSQLRKARLELYKRDIQIDEFIEDHLDEIKKSKFGENYKNLLNFESVRKSKIRSEFFKNVKIIKQQIYGKVNFQDFLEIQLNCLKVLFEHKNLIFSTGLHSGKSLLFLNYVKFCNKDYNNILYLTTSSKIKKIQQQIEIYQIENITVIEQNQIDQKKDQKYDLIILDSIDINLQILNYVKMCQQQTCNFIVGGFYDEYQILQFCSLFKLQKENVIFDRSFEDKFKNQNQNQITFSYEEDIIRSVTKFVKMKVEEDKLIKFNFNKSNLINFCIISSCKDTNQKLLDYFSNHSIKAVINNKNTQNQDCVILECIQDVDFVARNYLILDFKYQIQDLMYMKINFKGPVHIFLTQKHLVRARNCYLQSFINASVLSDIVKHVQNKGPKNQKFEILIDKYEKKYNFYDYENVLEYLMAYKYINLVDYEELKRINFFYIKSVQDFQRQIQGEKNCELLNQLNERNNFIIVNIEQYKQIEQILYKLKKQAVINYHVFGYKKLTFEINSLSKKKLKSNFVQIIEGFNNYQKKQLQKVDCLYTELKKIGFGYFSRSAKSESLDLDKILEVLQSIYFKEDFEEQKTDDINKMLPFTENYKKQDILKDFVEIYNKNLHKINKSTFNLKKLNEKQIFEAINIELIKQIFLDQKWKYKITSQVQEKMKKFNFLEILILLNNSTEILKKS